MSDSRIGSAAHVAHTAWIGIGAEPQKKLGCLQTNLASGEGDWRSADLVEGIDGHTDLRDQVAHGVDAAISRGAVQDEQRRSTELMQLPFPASEQLARSLVIAILKRSEDLAAHSMCHPRAATASGWKSKRPELSRRFFCLCEHGAPRPPTCPRGPCASGTMALTCGRISGQRMSSHKQAPPSCLQPRELSLRYVHALAGYLLVVSELTRSARRLETSTVMPRQQLASITSFSMQVVCSPLRYRCMTSGRVLTKRRLLLLTSRRSQVLVQLRALLFLTRL